MSVIFTTERLVLREWRPEDARVLLAMTGDPEVMRHVGDGRPWETIERAEGWLGRVAESYRERGYGFWAVVEKSSGREVGSCGFGPQPGTGAPEFGYLYARAVWGRGYATEAGRAVLRYGFERLGFARVVACVTPGHTASRRVLEKLGFEYVGNEVLEGEEEESAVYLSVNPESHAD